ncbi:MAG: hypothetical protein PHR15_05465 [Atopobiaceae bacterium]|nr:hypothetical protein [Atopobiaceae bacterium]MDD4380910.1 hypothetical protein [Atopobiaceae bacterium]
MAELHTRQSPAHAEEPHGTRRRWPWVLAVVAALACGVGVIALDRAQTASPVDQDAIPSGMGSLASTLMDATERTTDDAASAADLETSAEQARKAQELEAEAEARKAADDATAAAEDSSAITVDGADRSKAAMALGYLIEEVRDLEGSGYTIGFELMDVATGMTISYDVDTRYYSASSIKGPYVVYLVQNGIADPYGSMADTLSETLVNSDNDCYRTLRSTYGDSGFYSWCQGTGFDSPDGAYSYYTHYSAHELRLIWSAEYPYLTSDQTNASWCREALADTLDSPVSQALNDRYSTMSKAGWYNASEGYGSAPVTCVGGIVEATSGDYVVTVMCSAPSDFNPLNTMVGALDDAHTALLAS